MKTLKHGDFIRLETWGGSLAKAGSVEGYAKQNGESPEAALARAIERKHNLAWINSLPTTISASPHFHERDRQQRAEAIVLGPDEFVSIEGRTYKTRLKPGNINYARDQDAIQLVPA